jgi:hypothetical protein
MEQDNIFITFSLMFADAISAQEADLYTFFIPLYGAS